MFTRNRYDVQDYNNYGLNADFMCSTHSEDRTVRGIGASMAYVEMASDWLPSDGTSCTYDIYTGGDHESYMIYRIH